MVCGRMEYVMVCVRSSSQVQYPLDIYLQRNRDLD